MVSFDTTGSMYPALTQVRRSLRDTVNRLFDDLPNVNFAVIAHGDYCDERSTYLTKALDFTNNRDQIIRFVEGVGHTGGGDAPEAYEMVLREARSLSWREGSLRAVVMFGDANPHPPTDPQNKLRVDWRQECDKLREMGINIYSVQCLNRSDSTPFYREMASRTGGFHCRLDQFANVPEMILAACYRQAGAVHCERLRDQLKRDNKMSRGLHGVFATLLGAGAGGDEVSTFGARDLRAVPMGRFQMLEVGPERISIRDFVNAEGLLFAKGRGFYEFAKQERVQSYKEVVLLHKRSGDLFQGRDARHMLGLPDGTDVDIRPSATITADYDIFIQSTSVNRVLLPHSKFLYEVDLEH